MTETPQPAAGRNRWAGIPVKGAPAADEPQQDVAPTLDGPEISGGLAEARLRMSGVLLTQESVNTVVELVTSLAAATLPGTRGSGVSLLGHEGKRTTAASDPVVEQADLSQYELDEGPCLSAARERTVVRIDDLHTEQRWPRWREAVADLGLRSVLSVPLIAGGESIGAMKVYSGDVAAYDGRSERLLGFFAEQAAILLANMRSLQDAQQLSAQLKEALTNRDVIGQAKGILIAQGAANEEAAFGMLVSASQRTNVKLHEVAAQVVASVVGRRTTSPQS
jgi:GAF domain-containing protein